MKGVKILQAYVYGLIAVCFSSLVLAVDVGEPVQQYEELPMECGTLVNHYGPFDYTNFVDYSQRLNIVEVEHFTSNIEALQSGNTDILLGDIDYTLRAFPNHHRALAAISKFEFQVDNAAEQIDYIGRTPDCYFRRAIAFKPLDGIVRLIYATYLHRKNKHEAAEAQYKKALSINPQSAEVHYNMALLYYEKGKMNLAVEHGHKAYELGYPLPGLKEKLSSKGLWSDTISQN